MADPNIDWVPVSSLLDAAAKELGVGQLLHTSVFSLYEAMSAVEVGNPKMDAGCRPQGDSTPLEQRDLQLDLSQQQLIGVMDHLMACEATWHNGGALAKTVYSSMYMMQPQRTAQNVVLSAYCRALEAMCAEVNHLIMNGCVCEEEDFNAHIAGLPLEHVSTAAGAAAAGTNPGPGSNSSSSDHTDKVLAAISHAIDSQDLPLKRSQAGPDSQAAAAASLAAAIVARLQFRKLILSGMIRLKRRSKPDLDQAAKIFVRAQAELAVIRSSLGSGSDQGLGWDQDINSHLVPAVPPRVVQMYTPEKAVDYLESLLVQLQKVCHVTHVTSYQGLTDYLISFTAEPQCPIVRSAMHMLVGYTAWVPQQQQQQQQQQDPAAAATDSSGSSSSTYDQKHHQQHITPPDPHHTTAAAAAGSSDHANGIAAAATAAAAVPAWVLSPRMLCNALRLDPNEWLGDDGALFIEQALIASGNTIQALLMNRSRCRRRLRRGLEDWGNLYQHALNADNSVQFQAYMTVHGWKWENEHPEDIAGPLATWVEAETCSVMVQHLLMGFELSLYEPADYQMIYWYVDLLCMVWQTNISLLDKQQPARIVAPAAAAAAAAAAKNSSSSNKATNGLAGGKLPAKGSSKHNNSSSSKGAAAAAAAQQQPKRSPDVMLQGLILELWRQLCMGTLRLMMALEMLGMYIPPEHPFNSEAQRYDQRFASFHLLTRPDPLTYDQFKQSTSTEGVDVVQLLNLACGSFKQAIQAVAAIKSQAAAAAAASSGKQVINDLPKLERIAATNRVAAMLLARTAGASAAAAADGPKKAAAAATPQFVPHLDFGLLKWFPTVTLKSAAVVGAAKTSPATTAATVTAAAADAATTAAAVAATGGT